MQQTENNITRFAMHAGFGLGSFWVFKYLFIMGATKYPSLEFVNGFLIFFTPLLLLFYLVSYKNSNTENTLKYWQGVQLGILLFFFAALIESVIVYLHVTIIDPTYISKVLDGILEMGKSLNISDEMMEQVKKQSYMSPLAYTFNQIASNVFLGFILSLMLSPIASKININIKISDK